MASRTRVPPAARSRAPVLLALFAALGLVLSHSSALAQAISLSWQAPAECARTSVVQAQISHSLRPSHVPVRARVRITRARGRYQLRLQLTIDQHRAERRLHAESCEELSEAVVRLIALALEAEVSAPDEEPTELATDEPDQRAPAHAAAEGAQPAAHEHPVQPRAHDAASTRADEGAQDSARPSDQPERTAAPTAAAPPERRAQLHVVSRVAREPSERSLRGGVFAGVFAGGPSAPQATLGAFLGWSASWSYTQARFSGLLPRRIDIAPGASASVWSLALDLTQCALLGGTVRAGPCLALSGLRSSAELRGLSRARPQPALWANASAGMQLFWRITAHLEVSLSVSAGLPISPRPRFTVAGVGPVAAAKAWSSDARLGLSFRSK